MPKAEKGSIKDLGKRMKAKGLQKLKFWCQMCQKQCRDANGFQCHLASESHLNNMKIFSSSAHTIMDQYSTQFLKTFLDTLRIRHGTVSVNANHVYQEIIRDKQHVHMNATIWTTLTDFCKYLGKTKKCIVTENDRGEWFVSYINRDATYWAQEEAIQRKEAQDLEAEQLAEQQLEHQRRAAAAQAYQQQQARESAVSEATPYAGAVKIDLSSKKPQHIDSLKELSTSEKKKGRSVFDGEDDGDSSVDRNHDSINNGSQETSANSLSKVNPRDSKRLVSAEPSRVIPKKEKKQEKQNRDHGNSDSDHEDEEPWLFPGIVVRIVNRRDLPLHYFRRKAVVLESEHSKFPEYRARIQILPSKDDDDGGRHAGVAGTILEIDQTDVETVMPKTRASDRDANASLVRIVRGKYRGQTAFILALQKSRYEAQLRVQRKDGSTKILNHVDYADFSQVWDIEKQK
jgi:DNA/RNA-binding protein KIN17